MLLVRKSSGDFPQEFIDFFDDPDYSPDSLNISYIDEESLKYFSRDYDDAKAEYSQEWQDNIPDLVSDFMGFLLKITGYDDSSPNHQLRTKIVNSKMLPSIWGLDESLDMESYEAVPNGFEPGSLEEQSRSVKPTDIFYEDLIDMRKASKQAPQVFLETWHHYREEGKNTREGLYPVLDFALEYSAQTDVLVGINPFGRILELTESQDDTSLENFLGLYLMDREESLKQYVEENPDMTEEDIEGLY